MSDCADRDLSATWRSFLIVWGAPIVAAAAVGMAPSPAWAHAAAWVIAFTWMGGACFYNARRCGRVHCYVSGPILLLGASAATIVAFGAVEIGLDILVVATLVLSAATYLLETAWGRYRA